MKRSLPILLVLIALLLSSCAKDKLKPLSIEARKELLRAEMLKWENLQGEGVANLNYMGLTLRRMFVFAKTKDEMRFDVIDGGVLGAGASPLISLYMGEYVSLRSDYFPQLEMMAKTALDPRLSMAPIRDINALVEAHADSILATGKLVYEGVEIGFDPQFRLQRVYDPRSQSEALFTYNSKGQPDKLSFSLNNASAELLFDRVEYGTAAIEALPPQEGSILDQFLEPETFDEIAPLESETP